MSAAKKNPKKIHFLAFSSQMTKERTSENRKLMEINSSTSDKHYGRNCNLHTSKV